MVCYSFLVDCSGFCAPCCKVFTVFVKNAMSSACARRWCRQWTTCCVRRPWSRGRTWTAPSRPTLPPCYWTCWKRELSCWPTTCMGIGLPTERPALVRKQHWWCVNYSECMGEPQFVEEEKNPPGCESNFHLCVVFLHIWQRISPLLTLACCVSAIRSRGTCPKHRDGPAGLVLPTELRQRQHHPAFSLHYQTVQSQRSAALTPPRLHPTAWQITLSCAAHFYVSISCYLKTICMQLTTLLVHNNRLIRLTKVLRQFLFLMVS